MLKARHYAKLSGLLTVADDSGLSVDALGGAPGLYSAGSVGKARRDAERNRLLLEKLRGVPPRRARRPLHERRGGGPGRRRALRGRGDAWRGCIAEAPRGTGGFGYDPLFFYPPFGKTFGEVPRDDKDRVSHRGKAFARLRAFLDDAGLKPAYFSFFSSMSPEGLALQGDELLDALVGRGQQRAAAPSSSNGSSSAVPWISTKRPRPVFTTFMSTSAVESSS